MYIYVFPWCFTSPNILRLSDGLSSGECESTALQLPEVDLLDELAGDDGAAPAIRISVQFRSGKLSPGDGQERGVGVLAEGRRGRRGSRRLGGAVVGWRRGRDGEASLGKGL